MIVGRYPRVRACRPVRQLVNHLDFFRRVLDGTMKLANDQDADCFASWKVGGQDFYVYGTEQNAKGDSQNPGEKL